MSEELSPTDVLSSVASEILDVGLTQALGPDEVDFSARAIDKLRSLVEQNTIKQLIGRLRALVIAVEEYRNAPDDGKLSRLRRDARVLSSEFSEYLKHRNVYIHYQTAKSIHIGAIERTYALTKVEGEKANIALAGHDAVQQMLAVEKQESERLSVYSFACFKQFSLEGGDAKEVYRSLPKPVRKHDPDLLASLGAHYHGVIHGFFARIKGYGTYERQVPRAKYACKMVRQQSLAYAGEWTGATSGHFYRCAPKDGYYPAGDVFSSARKPVSALYIKPLQESPHLDEHGWRIVWDDGTADREDSYPKNIGRMAFWQYPNARLDSFGAMIEEVVSGAAPKRGRRILLLPVEDLTGAIHRGNRFSSDWNDSGSGADDDVLVRRIEPYTPDQGNTTDDLLDDRGGHFRAIKNALQSDRTGGRWIKVERLLGY